MSLQRFSKESPCPVCGGHEGLPRGHAERCWGFVSGDGRYVHCMRPEHAGGINQHPKTGGYPHRLEGSCNCGREHSSVALVRSNGHVKSQSPMGREVRRYSYFDEHGTRLFQTVRFANPKDFRQCHQDEAGRDVWNLTGVRRILYNLPAIVGADEDATVFDPEGEKDVDTLSSLGLLATCNPLGAGKWRDEYSASLAGRNVVILPDNDQVGREHAELVAKSLAGIAKSVKVVALPGLPEKGDVSDWLDLGHTVDELLKLVSVTAFYGAEPVTEATGMIDAELSRDYGHADVLAGLFKHRVRWAVHRGSWMRYDGLVWRPVPEEAIAKDASDTLRQHYAGLLATTTGKHTIGELTKKVAETCIFARVTGALAFLRGWPGILTLADEWDRDAWLLNVNNGTLHLRTGKLQPHDPSDLITKLAPVDYRPDAIGDNWDRHIKRFLPNENIRRQVQRSQGKALVGATLEEELSIWHGSGGNGKTTTARANMNVLGDYADRAAPNLLIQSKHDRHPAELADLAGKRLIFSVEVDQGKHLAEALVKDLTGGDTKKARHLYGDFFSFQQTFSIVLLVNHRPIIAGSDEGIWRRIRLVPWEYQITEAEKRPQEEVVSDLVADGAAMLNWLLAGLRDWQRDNAWVAPEVRAASDQYRAEMDVLSGFLGDCCQVGPRYEVVKSELYSAYMEWCTTNDEAALSKRELTLRLRDRGIGEDRGGKGVRFYVGIRLISHGQTERVTQGDTCSVTFPRERDSRKSTGNCVTLCHPPLESFLLGHTCAKCGAEMTGPAEPRQHDADLFVLHCACGNEMFVRRPTMAEVN